MIDDSSSNNQDPTYSGSIGSAIIRPCSWS